MIWQKLVDEHFEIVRFCDGQAKLLLQCLEVFLSRLLTIETDVIM